MKKKTITKVLSQVHTSWVNSIKDDEVKNLVAINSIITGGCIASMLLGEKVNDYDIYFRNKETVEAVANYYMGIVEKQTKAPYDIQVTENRVYIKIKSSGIIKLSQKDKKYAPIFITGNAITLTNKIQLVLRFFGEINDIHKNYDFDHCKSSWSSWDNKLNIPPQSAEALLAKELKYSGSLYPLSSIIRTRKFISRGWTINAGEYLKMAIQLNQLNLLDVNVLEDQLIGVDTTYFQMFIDDVRKKIAEDPSFELSASYVLSVIDQIFDQDISEEQEEDDQED